MAVDAWEKIRERVLERDGWMCQCCFSPGNPQGAAVDPARSAAALEVVPPDTGGRTLFSFPLRSFITLCAGCSGQERELRKLLPREYHEALTLAGISAASAAACLEDLSLAAELELEGESAAERLELRVC